ncbi:uncharacterized protein LOC133176529 [Saccostrea echinata]|uniref:uncharacterized protein LOC133176529 n=1 Tax=Saccostrea echinata TaxID=191078 RepID=UPI002A7F41F7|nr:uncharacterized protein LOC133176529 [Saccostrea echinata]
MIFHYGCLAYDIDSEVCLEKPFEFALSRTDCRFTLAEAKYWLKSETGYCSKKCQVKINNLESEAWSYYNHVYYTVYYQLTSLTLSFNDLGEKVTTIHSRCYSSTSYEKKTIEIICETGFENVVNTSKDLCISTADCWDASKTCLQSAEGQIGVCICKSGYIGFGKTCLKENLKLNEKCQRNEQCFMVFGSVCQNDTCSCRQVSHLDFDCFYIFCINPFSRI